MFNRSQEYTRTEIQKMVGGEIQTYLPQKNKIILAGCFNRELNPDCPNEIQAGMPPKVAKKAELLISQPQTIFPVFTKDLICSVYYRYEGRFRCISGSNDSKAIAIAEQKSGRVGGLSYVFRLEKVGE